MWEAHHAREIAVALAREHEREMLLGIPPPEAAGLLESDAELPQQKTEDASGAT